MGKKLIVTAKYDTLEYQAEASPYNPSAHEEQYNSCVKDINKQIDKANKSEMKLAFTFSHKII